MKITNIEKYRRANGMTQSQLAQKVGVTDGAVSCWENGKTTPSAMATIKMAQIFGCDPQDILGGEELRGMGAGREHGQIYHAESAGGQGVVMEARVNQ